MTNLWKTINNIEVALEEVRNMLNQCNEEINLLSTVKQKKQIDDYIVTVLQSSLNCITKLELDFLKSNEAQLKQMAGENIIVLANKLIVFKLFLSNLSKIQNLPFDKLIQEYLLEDFARMINFALQKKKKIFSFNNPQFYKHIETLQFNLIPVGNQSVNLAGVARSTMFKQSIFGMIGFCKTLINAGGNKPFYEMHFNPYRMRQFNNEGWVNVFQLSAHLLRINSKVKGVFGRAWFFDPNLKKISPELIYLQKLIYEIGGSFYFDGKSSEDKKNAFKMSKDRKKAFKEGRYDPSGYMAIIPKNKLLNYFASNLS